MNYVGSSKEMEATAALEMVIHIYDEHKGRIYVKEIISDDDSTMRAKVSNEKVIFKANFQPTYPLQNVKQIQAI